MEKPEILPIKGEGHDVEPALISTVDVKEGQIGDVEIDQAAAYGLSRRLLNRHIQMLAVGGAIGM